MTHRLLQVISAVAIGGFACPAQDAELRARINDALDMARPALLDHLQAAMRHGTRTGEVALLLLAALHDGVPLDDRRMQTAIGRLSKGKPDQTYDLALRLLVLEACPTFPDRDKLAKEDTKDLLQHCSKDGPFQYYRKPSAWDLSNTQYGALGLRAAVAMGQKVPRDVWQELAREIGDLQDSYGGFGYTPHRGRSEAYASMTAAGIAVLAICRQQLDESRTLAKKLDLQTERGWQWFAANADVIGSTKQRWSYYFHYGLERAAILCDVEKIGGRLDWYAQGARMLVDEQLAGGGWSSGTDSYPGQRLGNKRGDSVPTAFAVLFLRRKFQKYSGPITPHIVTLAAVGPKSKDGDVDACADYLIKRGKEAMSDIVKGLRSDIEPQRRAAHKALRGLAGEDFGYDPAADRDRNRDAVQQAELWYLRNR